MSWIAGLFFIESQGNHKEAVEKSLEGLIEKMKTEGIAEIINTSYDETLEENDNFSKTVEIEVEFENLTDFMKSVITYGPSAVEILETEKETISSEKFIESLGEILAITKNIYNKYGVFYKYVRPRGYKPKIGLTEDQIDSLLDQGALQIKIIVETKETDRRKARDNFLSAVDQDLFINKVKTKKLSGKEGTNLLVAVEAFVYELKDLISIIIQHTPVYVEIVEPETIELTQLLVQDIGVELANLYFDLTHRLAHHKMENLPPKIN